MTRLWENRDFRAAAKTAAPVANTICRKRLKKQNLYHSIVEKAFALTVGIFQLQ